MNQQQVQTIVDTFGFTLASPGGDSWGKGAAWIQSSLRRFNGIATDVRMSNAQNTHWVDAMLGVVQGLLYHLPSTPQGPLKEAVDIMMASRGRKITVRLSMYIPGERVSRDFVIYDRFMIDPNYNGGNTCVLVPV